MSFSFCLNKNELLVLAGFGLLFQALNLDRKGKLIQDSQRVLCSIISILERNAAVGATEFKKIACAMISVDRYAKSARALDDANNRRKSDGAMPAPKSISKSARKIQAMTSKLSTSSSPPMKQKIGIARRFTAPSLSTSIPPKYENNCCHSSSTSLTSDPVRQASRTRALKTPFHRNTTTLPNLDYLDFSHKASLDTGHEPQESANQSQTMERIGTNGCGNFQVAQTSLDNLLPHPDPFSFLSPSPSNGNDWCKDVWAEFPQHTQSVLSFSEEELTSGEEMSSCDTNGQLNSGLPVAKEGSMLEFDIVDGGFGL